MGKPAVLYTAPRRKTPLDIHQIAALAGTFLWCRNSRMYKWVGQMLRPSAPISPARRPGKGVLA